MALSNATTTKLPLCGRLPTQPIALFALFLLTMLFLWTSMRYVGGSDFSFRAFEDSSREKEKQPLVLLDTRELAVLLLDVYQQLEQSFQSKKPPSLRSLKALRSLAARLYPPVDTDLHAHAHPPPAPLVCPERYFGPKSPEGWHTSNCTGVPPLGDLVTVLVNVREEAVAEKKGLAKRLLRDFFDSYPDVRVVVVDSGLSSRELSGVGGFDAGRVELLDSSSSAAGHAWNAAVQRVTTPLVFVARDVWRFSAASSPLDRVVRVLSEVPGVGAVGGGLRNRNGQWKVGCFQSDLKNYALKYQKGYHFSKNESMFCDYVDGPFVTYTRLLKQTVLDERLESDVLFQDFFLHLTRDWLAAVCPDAMFYSRGPMTDAVSVVLRDTWLEFARKWELNRIAIESSLSVVLHKYSCSDVGISCGQKKDATSSFAIPVCCQEEFAGAVARFAAFCDAYNMSCQFDSGSCLGAVKMSDLMPWDLDGDAGYPEQNYSFIESMAPEFKKHGFKLGHFEGPACCDKNMPNGLKRSYFKIMVSGMYVELWGDWWIPYDAFLFNETSARTDTKIEIHGTWVSGPPNPGQYARKRYGPECLRHAQSWLHLGMKTSWEPYEAGRFNRCKNRRHHACLDRLPVDGNIGFLVPE